MKCKENNFYNDVLSDVSINQCSDRPAIVAVVILEREWPFLKH